MRDFKKFPVVINMFTTSTVIDTSDGNCDSTSDFLYYFYLI